MNFGPDLREPGSAPNTLSSAPNLRALQQARFQLFMLKIGFSCSCLNCLAALRVRNCCESVAMQLQDRAHMVGLHVACRKPRWSKPRRPTQNRAFSLEVCQFNFMVVNLRKLKRQKHLKYWRSKTLNIKTQLRSKWTKNADSGCVTESCWMLQAF